jgi:hypothetical protein
MRRSIKTLTATCLGLLLFSAHSALANNIEQHSNTICYKHWQNLHLNGYSENAVYTATGILQLLNNMRVKPGPLPYLTEDNHYQLIYTCYVDHGLAHLALHAIPLHVSNVPDTSNYITTIAWTMSR